MILKQSGEDDYPHALGGKVLATCRVARAWLSQAFQHYFFVVAAGGCLLPFVALAFYSYPAHDDFVIGEYLRTRSMAAYLADNYLTSSGRYASTLSSVVIKMFGLHPAAYQWLVLAGLLALVLGLCVAAAAAGAGQLVAPISSVLVGAMLLNFPKPADGFYYLTGEVAYFYPIVLLAWLVALLAWLAAHPGTRGRWLAWVAAVALAGYIPGFSEITALLLPLVVVGVGIALWPRRPGYGWLAVAGAVLLGSLLTLATPAHHQQWHPALQLTTVVRTSGAAAFHAVHSVVNWLGNGLLPLWLLLALPLSLAYSRAASERFLVQRLTRSLWLWPLLTLAGLWLSFFFYQMATQDAMAPRVINLVYGYFVAGCVLSAHAGFRRLPPRYRSLLLASPVRVALALAWLLALLTDHSLQLWPAQGEQGYGTVLQAYRDWLSGDAARYEQQQLARMGQLRAPTPGASPLRLDPLRTRPVSLFYADLSANPAAGSNVVYSAFWRCSAVYVAEPTN
jgi:hypothetical protein